MEISTKDNFNRREKSHGKVKAVNRRKVKTQAVARNGSGVLRDVQLDENSDFLPPRSLNELIQNLHLYQNELENIGQWLGEQFPNSVAQKAKQRLTQSIVELKALEKTANKMCGDSVGVESDR
jgi:hypothetical protein